MLSGLISASVWTYLRDTGHIETAIVGWAVGVVMTGIVIGLIVRPGVKRVRAAWARHEATQTTIADRLDADTPSGIGAVIAAVDAASPAANPGATTTGPLVQVDVTQQPADPPVEPESDR